MCTPTYRAGDATAQSERAHYFQTFNIQKIWCDKLVVPIIRE